MKFTLAASILALSSAAAFAENPMVGGAAMYENKNIIENAVNSADHTTLVAAVKAAGLVETLSGPLLMAIITSDDCMPTRCCTAPEMPQARYILGQTVFPVCPT